MFIRLQKGITLIEVLIAAGVLALIMGSTVALGRSVTRNQIITQDRAQALALTVEAAEIIRNLRDSTYVDQAQNRFNEFLASSNCANIKCENLEISWDATANTNNWTIENQTTKTTTIIDPNIETDDDLDGEVIKVDISTGDLSDNTSRTIAGATAGHLNHKCADTVSGSLLYCRKITLMPIVYDQNSNAAYDSAVDYDSIIGHIIDPVTGLPKPVVPLITEEDSTVEGDSVAYTFDAYVNASFKIISEITWNEFGTTRSVDTTDIITNWR